MTTTVKDLTSRMIIGNLDIPLFIVMRPNPQIFERNCSKTFSESQTMGGWVNEHWGNKQDIISCAGISCAKYGNPSGNEGSMTLFNNTDQKSSSYTEIDKAMIKLEQLYKLDKERMMSVTKMFGDISSFTGGTTNRTQKITAQQINSLYDLTQSFIIYRSAIYLGFFTDFQMVENSESPRIYNYNFKFKVTMNSTDFFTKSLMTNFPEARALNLFREAPAIAQTTLFMIKNADKVLKSALF